MTGAATLHREIFDALAAPFPDDLVRQREGDHKRVYRYVTARAVMNRLDEVLGPENWTDEYTEFRGGLKCRITLVLPDGSTVFKEDGGACRENDPNGEKSAFSIAFKRAAVKLGIGRYFYREGVPDYGSPRTLRREQAPEKPAPKAPPPPERAPAPAARTNGHAKERHDWPAAHAPGTNGTATAAAPPATHKSPSQVTGRALYDRIKRLEVSGIRCQQPLADWGLDRGYPGRFVQWSDDQAAAGFAELNRQLSMAESQELRA